MLISGREKICKAIKGKDQYGPVIPIVEKKKRELAQEGITDIHQHNENGVNHGPKETDISSKPSNESAVALFSS